MVNAAHISTVLGVSSSNRDYYVAYKTSFKANICTTKARYLMQPVGLISSLRTELCTKTDDLSTYYFILVIRLSAFMKLHARRSLTPDLAVWGGFLTVNRSKATCQHAKGSRPGCPLLL